MIIIRADANSTIGSGHVMRCMTIAGSLISKGESVIFATADSGADSLLNAAHMEHVSLGTDYRNMESETGQMEELIKKYDAKLVLADSYQVTPGYLNAISGICPVAYMDDMCDKAYPADAVINYNIHAGKEKYKALYAGAEKNTKLVTGLKYVPLRKQFTEYLKGVSKKSGRQDSGCIKVLFTAGGADPLNISKSMAQIWSKRLGDRKDCHLDIICGALYEHAAELGKQIENTENISLHINVKDMAAAMGSADIAVAATGSTIYELCAMGVPTISFYYVENQRQIAEAFEKQTPVHNCGDMSTDRQAVMGEVYEQLDRLMADAGMRREISLTMKKLVDGKGADRIADILLDMAGGRNET